MTNPPDARELRLAKMARRSMFAMSLSRAVLWSVGVLAAASACGSGSSDAIVADGEEKGRCYPNGTCNAGLSCFSNRCVQYLDGNVPPTTKADASVTAGSGGSPNIVAQDGASETVDASGMGGTTGAGGVNDSGVSTDAASSTDVSADRIAAEASKDTGGPDACVPIGDAAVGATDQIVVPACGYNPATTTHAYRGVVLMKATGVLVNSGFSVLDTFYNLDPNDTSASIGDCPDCVHYSRVSEGNCVCLNFPQCPSHRVADLLIESYPAYNPTHEYTVKLDLGANPPERLNFGMADCGCDDNSGTLTISIVPMSNSSCSP